MLYRKNNIVFRIASSSAISKFKQLQAHSFLQVTRSELNFNSSAKEALLLEYDRVSQWIFRTERSFLSEHEHKRPSPAIIEACMHSFLEELKTCEEIMWTHKDVFTKEIVSYMSLIHQYSYHAIEETFSKVTNCMVTTTFSTMVDFASDYLQHVLVAAHEFNNNAISKQEKPFISVTNFSANSADYKYLSEIRRVQFFKDNYDISSFTLKNYTPSPIIGLVDKLKQIGIECVDEMAQA